MARDTGMRNPPFQVQQLFYPRDAPARNHYFTRDAAGKTGAGKESLIVLQSEGACGLEVTAGMYWIVLPLAFLAATMDAIAGGGGVISLPAYLKAGLTPVAASGSNKFSAMFGSLMATIRFIRSGRMPYAPALLAAAGALPGSYLGAEVLRHVSDQWMRAFLLVALKIAPAQGAYSVSSSDFAVHMAFENGRGERVGRGEADESGLQRGGNGFAVAQRKRAVPAGGARNAVLGGGGIPGGEAGAGGGRKADPRGDGDRDGADSGQHRAGVLRASSVEALVFHLLKEGTPIFRKGLGS
jgi:uncharacterized membrane protein YfcA